MASESSFPVLSWGAYRSRHLCSAAVAQQTARAEKAASQARSGGRFVKEAAAASTVTAREYRSTLDRAQREITMVRERYDKYVEETKAKTLEEQAEHIRILMNLQSLLADKTRQLKELKRMHKLVMKIPGIRAQAERPSLAVRLGRLESS
jgi:hypothetical protein